MGWRGRQEGGSGRGTHVNPWLIHVNVWQKPLQDCEVISFHLIKINEKKKKKRIKKNEVKIQIKRSDLDHRGSDFLQVKFPQFCFKNITDLYIYNR